jgi:hypothetical protein
MNRIPILGTAIVNNPYWLYRLFYSIDYPVDKFVIVDNSGGDITNQILDLKKQKHPYINNVEIISFPRNTGCPNAWNIIIKTYFDVDGWLITNHDVMFKPNTLSQIMKESENEDVGIIQPIGHHNIGSFDLFFIKDWVVKKVGFFDENFYPGYGEDIDYLIRLKRSNIKSLQIKMDYIHGNAENNESYFETGQQTIKSFDENQKNKIFHAKKINEEKYLIDKWGKNFKSLNITKEPFSESTQKYNAFDFDLIRLKNMNLIKEPQNIKSEKKINIIEKKEFNVIDFFGFHPERDINMLELRYDILKDYVDMFVVCEQDKTHTGIKIETKLKEILSDLNIPQEKFLIITQNVPNNENLKILDIDIDLSFQNQTNTSAYYCRARERIQKNALLDVYQQFDDNTVFMHSDIDEIINPKNIHWVSRLLLQSECDEIIKIPLVYLEGYGDLRVYDKNKNIPIPWDESLFFCTKKHLNTTTPHHIRNNYKQPFNIVYPVIDNIRLEDMGWHFSFMGTKEERLKKIESTIHHFDANNKIIGGSYQSSEYLEHISKDPKENNIPPSGYVNRILKKYHHSLLPNEILNNENRKKYFLGI